MRILLLLLAVAVVLDCQVLSGKLALSWLDGFCQSLPPEDPCADDALALWDHQSFTIHGLWPDDNTGKPKYGVFEASLLKKQLLNDLNNFWPARSKKSQKQGSLWQHEWQKHGNYYSQIVYKLFPKLFSKDQQKRNKQLLNRYFQDTIDLYKKINARKLPKDTFNKSELASFLGVGYNQLMLSCIKGNILKQIKIGFTITKDGIVLTDLTNSKSKCDDEVRLSGWTKEYKQERVTQLSKVQQEQTEQQEDL